MPVADLLQPVQPEHSRGYRMLSQVISWAAREQRDRWKPGGQVTERGKNH